jgi:trehalose 6-phosphate phosphatase
VPLPDIVHGKRVLNLLPPEAPHKGEALQSLLGHSGCARAVYVGDDVTDEDVFRMRMPEVLSIRVGRKRKSAAAMYLKNQADVTRLVRRLVAMLDGSRHASRPYGATVSPIPQ